MRDTGKPTLTGLRRNIDDDTIALLEHPAQKLAGKQDRRSEVDVQVEIKFFIAQFDKGAGPAHSSVVDQDINASHEFGNGLGGANDVLGVRQITDQAQRSAPAAGGRSGNNGLFQRFAVATKK